MKKSLIIAAALSAMALSTAGMASAAPAVGHLGGVNAAAGSQLEQVHYNGRRHAHNRRFYNNRRYNNRRYNNRRYGQRQHCFLRIGKRVCVLR